MCISSLRVNVLYNVCRSMSAELWCAVLQHVRLDGGRVRQRGAAAQVDPAARLDAELRLVLPHRTRYSYTYTAPAIHSII